MSKMAVGESFGEALNAKDSEAYGQLKYARGGNRTPTGRPTGSLILRVYQFRHPSEFLTKP